MVGELASHSKEYKEWLSNLKARIRQVQLKAAVTVNRELLQFYWELGVDIIEKQKNTSWGDGFLKQLSKDLIAEFPGIKGFSKRNLELVRQWYLFWSGHSLNAKQPVSHLDQQPVSQIMQIPWGNNLTIIAKCKNLNEAIYYVNKTLAHGWSRSVLTHQIESGLWKREGKAISNFSQSLPAPQSDLANQMLKDPYVFDFLTLTKEHDERGLERDLIQHITQFLLELGSGFAYIGKQISIQVGERNYFLDLLFYHTQLHAYVIVELKTVDFEPEHAGKLNFYIKAVDAQLRNKGDHPTIGLLLCKSRDKVVVEYALSDINKPIGVSEYRITQSLPEALKSSLPGIEEVEAELSRRIENEK